MRLNAPATASDVIKIAHVRSTPAHWRSIIDGRGGGPRTVDKMTAHLNAWTDVLWLRKAWPDYQLITFCRRHHNVPMYHSMMFSAKIYCYISTKVSSWLFFFVLLEYNGVAMQFNFMAICKAVARCQADWFPRLKGWTSRETGFI